MLKRVLMLSVLIGTLASGALAASSNFYVVANLASYHVNANSDFNEINPGLGLGYSVALGAQENWEIGAEVGFYKNSYSENTRYGLINVNYPIAKISESVELRAGAFVGLFEYPTAVAFAKSKGLPTFDDFIMVPGLSASLRFDEQYDVMMKVVPASSKADAIISLQMAYRF